MGTDGFEFIEYTAPDPTALARLFEQLGFSRVARHRSKEVALYRQGDINFILNSEPDSFARSFARVHGPSVCAMALRVRDAGAALKHAMALGARAESTPVGPMELNIPAIRGIGGSLIYLVDRYGDHTIYDVDFLPEPGYRGNEVSPNAVRTSFACPGGAPPRVAGVGLTAVDHLTHNVHRGRMQEWVEFYERLFDFTEIRTFHIAGRMTGLHSKALISPCGKIRIPINESADDRSQIEEYLAAYHGEGIQHIALGTDDIYATVEALKGRGVRFLETPDTYYELVEKRLPDHGEPAQRLKADRIQIDGSPGRDGKRLLQIFTETVIGPIFFEIIQRKGDEGFGEGNFQALFEAMELDQIRRGVLKAPQ